MGQHEKGFKVRTTILWFIPLIFLDRELAVGTTTELMSPLDSTLLRFLADDTIIRYEAKPETPEQILVTKTKKTTLYSSRSGGVDGKPGKLVMTDAFYYGEINDENIMFARGCLATLTGTSRKIIWT